MRAVPRDAYPFLWLCGASGVGKSSVGWEIQTQLTAEGVRNAYLDLDQIGWCRPAPVDDPDNHLIRASNLGAMWANFRNAGARCLVISGCVDTEDEVRLYADAVADRTLTLCRLRVRPAELRERIFVRGAGGGPVVPGDEIRGASHERLSRQADEAMANGNDLDRAGLGHLIVDTDGVPVVEVVRRVRSLAGHWPSLRS